MTEHAGWMALFNAEPSIDFYDRQRWHASAQRRLAEIKREVGMTDAANFESSPREAVRDGRSPSGFEPGGEKQRPTSNAELRTSEEDAQIGGS